MFGIFVVVIFTVFPIERINVSTGFADGWYGGIFSLFIFLLYVKSTMTFEENGGPLSDSCVSGFPSWSYMFARTGITSVAFVEDTISPLGIVKRGLGWLQYVLKKASAPKSIYGQFSQHLSGMLCGLNVFRCFFICKQLVIFACFYKFVNQCVHTMKKEVEPDSRLHPRFPRMVTLMHQS